MQLIERKLEKEAEKSGQEKSDERVEAERQHHGREAMIEEEDMTQDGAVSGAEVARPVDASQVGDFRTIVHKRRENKRADIRITTNIQGEATTDILVDHTTSSIHVPSNRLDATRRFGVTDKAENTKKESYAIWDHQGQIIGFGCDSNGTIG